MKIAISAITISLALTACAADPNNHTLVILQNPKTKETKECRGDAWSTWNVYAQVEACAKAYEKAGFVRLGDY